MQVKAAGFVGKKGTGAHAGLQNIASVYSHPLQRTVHGMDDFGRREVGRQGAAPCCLVFAFGEDGFQLAILLGPAGFVGVKSIRKTAPAAVLSQDHLFILVGGCSALGHTLFHLFEGADGFQIGGKLLLGGARDSGPIRCNIVDGLVLIGFREGFGICHDLLYKRGIFAFFLRFRLHRRCAFFWLRLFLNCVRQRQHLQVCIPVIPSKQPGKIFPVNGSAEQWKVLVLHQNIGLANILHHIGLAIFQIHHIPWSTGALDGGSPGSQFSLLFTEFFLGSVKKAVIAHATQFMGNQFCCGGILRCKQMLIIHLVNQLVMHKISIDCDLVFSFAVSGICQFNIGKIFKLRRFKIILGTVFLNDLLGLFQIRSFLCLLSLSGR